MNSNPRPTTTLVPPVEKTRYEETRSTQNPSKG